MQFTKWVRKNRQTIMVVVLVLCMITFVGGVGFTELLKYLGQGGKVTLATYDNGKKITNQDLYNARQELEILKAIQANVVLLNKPNAFGMMDIHGVLLGYLLFGDSQSAAQIRNQLRQATMRGQISVSSSQIDDYFSQQTESPDMSWIILCAEASKAGIVVSNEQSAEELKVLIPMLSGKRYSAAQVIGGVAAQMNISNDHIVATYGKLLGILKWAEMVCNNEDATLAQIRSDIGRSKNRIDADFAQFQADWFIDKQAQPTDLQIQTQFDAYKEMQRGQLTDQNPYGFGYKLPKRVQVEYFYILNDDVAKIAGKPTNDDIEKYYNDNYQQQFTDSRPKDPNSPEGEKITETKSIAEVFEQIRQILEEQNTDKLTQLIFKDIRDLLDTELISLNLEKASAEEIRKAAVDFASVKAKVTEKHKIPVYTGKTGLLGQMDFGADNCLAYLRTNHAGIQTPLIEAVYAIDSQNAAVAHKVGVYVPRIWENIGPLQGAFHSETNNTSTPITIICRVVDVQPSEVPAAIDLTYSTASLTPSDKKDTKKIFNLKQQITEDFRKITAMNDAKAAAEEFKKLITQADWDKAVDKYNAQYAPKDPNTVKDKGFTKLTVTSQKNQLLASASDIAQFQQMAQANPVSAGFVQTRIVSNMLNQKLFDLLADKPQTGIISEMIELKPALSCYVVKSITRQPATTDDYTQNKSYKALQIALDSASEMGLTHFNPSDIRKRMNYTLVKQDKSADTESKDIPVEK